MPTNNQPCDRSVYIAYTNHRGEHNPRRLITPVEIVFGRKLIQGATESHWMLSAWCHERQAFRLFALSLISNMTPYVPEE